MKAKKLIAIFMAAIMALSLFAIMTGCDSAEESYVGAWSLSDTEEQYATFDEDGTCVQIIYVEDDTFFEEGGAYIGMEGTYEEINGGISVTYDILGKKKTIEDSKESFFGDDAVYTSIKMSEVPSDYYTFDEYIDLAMDYVADMYADYGMELSDEDYDTMRQELVDSVLESIEDL